MQYAPILADEKGTLFGIGHFANKATMMKVVNAICKKRRARLIRTVRK